MNSREKALEELRRRIEEQKARVDPKLLRRAAEVALSGTKSGQAAPSDRAAAIRVVEIFLEEHKDREGFERRLAELIFKNRN
ncbi:MAG: hypothetical protein EPN97_07025 [Alphaproteobacteria bacterium]|nr:MAG: hypothetical protein EPN97_07025 [Alphaproteobacteria bacterium]